MAAGFQTGLKTIGEAAFGEPQLITHYYNDTLHDVQGQQAKRLGELGVQNDAAAQAYANAVAASTPQYNELNQDTISRLTGLANQYMGRDEMANYERLRSGNFGAVDSTLGKLASADSAANQIARLKLGIGGRGPTSYDTKLRTNTLADRSVPLYNTILANLGNDSMAVNRSQLNDLAATTGLLQARLGLPGAADARTLLPAQARTNMLAQEIPLGGQLADSSKADVSGYEQKANKWAKFMEGIGQSTDQAIDTYISMYGGGAFGGGGGGGLGGMGGGGGGGGGASGGGSPSGGGLADALNARLGSGSGFGGASAGGGGNMQQIIQLIMGLLGKSGGGGNSGGLSNQDIMNTAFQRMTTYGGNYAGESPSYGDYGGLGSIQPSGGSFGTGE